MPVRVLCAAALLFLTVTGCASLGEGYSTHFGLANPDNPPIHPDLVDETYAGGTVDAQSAEAYEKKYREKDVLQGTVREPIEERVEQTEEN